MPPALGAAAKRPRSGGTPGVACSERPVAWAARRVCAVPAAVLRGAARHARLRRRLWCQAGPPRNEVCKVQCLSHLTLAAQGHQVSGGLAETLRRAEEELPGGLQRGQGERPG